MNDLSEESDHQSSLQCCQGFETTMREIYPLPSIDIGDRWQVPLPPKKIQKNFLLGNYHVKFVHFVNFSCIYFWAKKSFPLQI